MSSRPILSVLAVLLLAGCAGDPARDSPLWAQDAALTKKVQRALAAEVGRRASSVVSVDTYNGTVQLTGFVDSAAEKARAAEVARQVEGVRSVKNDLRVKSPS